MRCKSVRRCWPSSRSALPQHLLDLSVDYAKSRLQFGRQIGSFQAIKHKLADMLVDLEHARSTAYHAVWALGDASDDPALAASIAQASASAAFSRIAADTIQVHGGYRVHLGTPGALVLQARRHRRRAAGHRRTTPVAGGRHGAGLRGGRCRRGAGRDGVPGLTAVAARMEMVATAPAQMGPGEIGDWAARAERIGYDTIHISETIHDPFTVAAFALQRTTHLTVRTSMVVAFPRSPMITAYAAWDLAKDSGGRFQLGIASQVRGNIVGRFSTEWSEPVARLGDYIGALRAIFHSFQTGADLDYTGPHYRFDRLQPYFNPGPLEHAAPQIWTGAVNTRMCVMAGELADGFVCHPTTSHPVVLRAHTLPALAEGASRADRGGEPLAVIANPQPMMAPTMQDVEALREARRSELAFLYSTPAYRRQLEYFGLGDVGLTPRCDGQAGRVGRPAAPPHRRGR